MKSFVCALCNCETVGWGNNPAPLAKLPQLACDDCNATKVLRARLMGMLNKIPKKA